MAALLNPTALSLEPPVDRPAPGPVPVAPWNRVESRSSAGPARHLQVVAAPASATGRSPLRVLVAGLGLAVLMAFAAMGIVPFLGADAAASTPASSTELPQPEVAATVAPPAPTGPQELVVQSGDSLWTIARRLQPRGDLRHLVDRLIERVGGTSVTRGQHIDVRGLLD